MNHRFMPPNFRLPDDAHPRICSLFELWLKACDGGLPDVTCFDVTALSAEYPLLARIGIDDPGRVLVWRELPANGHWPFGAPVSGRPVVESVPPLSVRRVMNSFTETLESGMPDYFETTSWMYGGRTRALSRLVVPVNAGAGRELIALWETMTPPAAP
ncbi:hypothetical protein OEG84_07505 [Hoeflea sp. G2-23]|uniref:PAS domain-containing protein n=1 Tax=Hoeflea algicola TaxID=2983763 RepID=A0ABT3Z724_9HYPH|nr:hypothetical protein [Hoeflea algicola]MCY0147563.1 hypothetical protein [Hoeflea algicola]